MLFFDDEVQFSALLLEEGLIPVPLDLQISPVALKVSALCNSPGSLGGCCTLLHKMVIAIHFLSL